MGAGGFRGFQRGAFAIHFLHQFQLAGFQLIHFLLIAGDFMADRLIFLVLAGLELLGFQAHDRVLAGTGIEFEAFQAQFAIDHRIMGAGDGRFVAGELVLRPGFVLGQFFEVFGERQQAAVTVLENQQRTDFI